MRTSNLVKEKDSALGSEGAKGKKPNGSSLRNQKVGDAALWDNKQDGWKPQYSDLLVNVLLLLLLLEGTQEDRFLEGLVGGKTNLIWDIFPWSFGFCQSHYIYC